MPGAEFHLFTGAATYGSVGDKKADAMAAVIKQAESLEGQGIKVRGPVSKSVLIEEFKTPGACSIGEI